MGLNGKKVYFQIGYVFYSSTQFQCSMAFYVIQIHKLQKLCNTRLHGRFWNHDCLRRVIARNGLSTCDVCFLNLLFLFIMWKVSQTTFCWKVFHNLCVALLNFLFCWSLKLYVGFFFPELAYFFSFTDSVLVSVSWADL